MSGVTDDDLGQVTLVGDTVEIVFHRRLPKPVEKVWAALTVPERIADWFAETTLPRLELGAPISIYFPVPNVRADGRITALEPLRRIAWTWPQPDGTSSVVTFELEPDGDGCRLTLTEAGLSASQAAGNAGGWHAHLEALEDACEGVRTSWATLLEREAKVNARYKEAAPA
jgi:uncharacterized protein YndB with AHSA1/START domain